MHINKNILIFCPSIEDGGVEKNLYLISNYLAKNKYKVDVITANKDKKNNFINKVNFYSPKSKIWSSKSRILKLIICIKLFFFNYKKNNFIMLSFQSNISAIILSKISNKKIIIRSNTDPSAYINNFIKKYIFKFILNFADRIICNSYEFRRNLKKIFNINATVIYNPFFFNKIQNSKFFFNNKLNILSIGRLTEQKNHLCALRAIKLIKNKIPLKYIIIGKGKLYLELKNYIKKNKLYKNVKLIGYQKNPHNFIKKSDIFVLSSNFEGLPNVLLEAIYYKKIIVSTNCPSGPKEILLNGKGGFLFPVNDYKKLSEILIYIYNNFSATKKKVLLSSKNFSRFDYKTNIIKYEKIIKNT